MDGDPCDVLRDAYEVLEKDTDDEYVAPSWDECNYAGLEALKSGLPAAHLCGRTQVCAYRILCEREHPPVLLLALRRSAQRLSWAIRHCEVDSAIEDIERMLVDAFGHLGPAPAYRGWRLANGSVQLWFELKCSKHVSTDLRDADGWRWVLPSDVVNEREVAGDPIDPAVVADVLGTPELCILRDSETGVVAPPSQSAFHVGGAPGLGYAATIGVKRADSSAPFGPHYYVDSFRRAVAAMSGDSSSIVRYVWTPGRHTMLLGRATDQPDRSLLTLHLGAGRPMVRAAAKARDADARWARECDSVSRGRLAVDVGGTRHVMEPRGCTTDIGSFIPLDYAWTGAVSSCISSRISYIEGHEHAD